MQDPNIWTDSGKVSKLGQEIKEKKDIIEKLNHWNSVIEDSETSLDLMIKNL